MSPTGSATQSQLAMAETRAIVQDLFTPNPVIFWADLLVTTVIAYACALAYFEAPMWSLTQIACFTISGFALHRIGNFIHEIAHLNARRSMKWFRVAWNVLVGIPTLMPSYFFETHMSHHNTHDFGTATDCEYVPLGSRRLRNIVFFLCQVFIQPLFVIVRFTLVAPISFLHPRLRQWVLENFSSFVFVWPCPRKIPHDAPRAAWAAMDVACSLRAWAIFVCAAIGVTSWERIPQLYALALLPLTLHYIRSLTAHNYLAPGKPVSFLDQLLDSIDITGNRFTTEFVYPIGLRYHALHHLFPSMPYHNLGVAHRRLLAQLPADSPYRMVVYPSFWSVIRELLQHARQVSQQSESAPSPHPRQMAARS